MSEIIGVLAREILDSRGNPTVEVELQLFNIGVLGRAAIPTGAFSVTEETLKKLRDALNSQSDNWSPIGKQIFPPIEIGYPLGRPHQNLGFDHVARKHNVIDIMLAMETWMDVYAFNHKSSNAPDFKLEDESNDSKQPYSNTTTNHLIDSKSKIFTSIKLKNKSKNITKTIKHI